MSAEVGFVYILVNDYMAGVYKIGCTERSPHARAAELSKSTGVPAPFTVLCYVEVENFQSVEREFHAWMADWRISPAREFFDGGLEYAVRLMYWLPKKLSFCACGQLPSLIEEMDIFSGAELSDTTNPWNPLDTTATSPTEHPIDIGPLTLAINGGDL